MSIEDDPYSEYYDEQHAIDDIQKKFFKILAVELSKKAYCPYSKFPVGAVVLCKDTLSYFGGCNYENAAYGSTICAERNAIGTMIAAGELKPKCVFIYTPTPIPSAPCGSCRQVINEFAPDCRIISFCNSDEELDCYIKDLLPNAFGPHNLT